MLRVFIYWGEHMSEETSKQRKKQDDTKVVINILLFVVPLLICLFLRVTPYYIPIADQWAHQTVYNSLQAQVYSRLQSSYPGLGPQELQDVVKEEVNKVIQEQGAELAQAEQQTAEAFRNRLRNDNGTTYLLAIDPYYYLRNAQNILEHGYEADIKTERGYIDTHIFGGLPISARNAAPDKIQNILPWIEAYLFRILNFLGFNIDLMAVAFFTPVILGLLTVIIAFFVGKDISKSNIGGFFVALYVAIHPFLLSRSLGGFADTDIFNALFPLALIFFFFKLLESTSLKKKLLHSALFGLVLAIYTKAWGGWWYTFDLILLSIVIYAVYRIFFSFILFKKHSRRTLGSNVPGKLSSDLISIGLLLLFSCIFVSLFIGFNSFINSPLAALRGTELKAVSKGTIWPNVFTTVAELNPGDFGSIVQNNGGWLAVLVAFSGIALLLKRKGSIIGPKMAQFFLVLFWTLATIYTVYSGVRFNLLIVPAFALAWGIASAVIINQGSLWVKKLIDIPEKTAKVVLFALLLLILVLPQSTAGGDTQSGMLPNAINTARGHTPQMADAWFETLTKIKEESQEEAIINSWWDFGHWFKAIADRPVTLDGGIQNNPQAHWLGKLMLTNDERLSVGILRMLDCGATLAYDTIYNLTNDDLEAIDTLYKILEMDRDEANSFLEEKFGKEDALRVLNYSHCNPPENYFIASEDMVSKSGVWAHFGSWNFTKAKMFYEVKSRKIDEAREFLKDRFNFSEVDAANYVTEIRSVENADYWVAPWPSYVTSDFTLCQKINDSWVRCMKSFSSNQGVVLNINVDDMRAYAMVNQNTQLEVRKFVFSKDDEVYVRNKPDSGFNYGVVLKEEGGQYSFVLSDTQLADSMFTRLFFLDGAGTNYFNLFSHKTDMFGNDIYVWKVDWNPNEIKDNFHVLEEDEAVDLIDNQESTEQEEETEVGGEEDQTEKEEVEDIENISSIINSTEQMNLSLENGS